VVFVNRILHRASLYGFVVLSARFLCDLPSEPFRPDRHAIFTRVPARQETGPPEQPLHDTIQRAPVLRGRKPQRTKGTPKRCPNSLQSVFNSYSPVTNWTGFESHAPVMIYPL
jgi:hypothetical protein